jgi:hypothetical protein
MCILSGHNKYNFLLVRSSCRLFHELLAMINFPNYNLNCHIIGWSADSFPAARCHILNWADVYCKPLPEDGTTTNVSSCNGWFLTKRTVRNSN